MNAGGLTLEYTLVHARTSPLVLGLPPHPQVAVVLQVPHVSDFDSKVSC